MTKRHYFQSLIILGVSFYLVKTIFNLHFPEAIVIIALAIICVIHTMDVRDDVKNRLEKRRKDGRSPGPTPL